MPYRPEKQDSTDVLHGGPCDSGSDRFLVYLLQTEFRALADDCLDEEFLQLDVIFEFPELAKPEVGRHIVVLGEDSGHTHSLHDTDHLAGLDAEHIRKIVNTGLRLGGPGAGTAALRDQ